MKAIVGFASVVMACTTGGSGGGGGGGGAFPADQISATVTSADTGGRATVMLASTPRLCDDATASPPIDRAGQHYIAIDLEDVANGTTTAPIAPGAYTIYPNTGTMPAHTALLRSGDLDATCQPLGDINADSGTVTIASISGAAFAGSYDVVLSSGEHLTGSFAPSACAALATALATSPHRCE